MLLPLQQAHLAHPSYIQLYYTPAPQGLTANSGYAHIFSSYAMLLQQAYYRLFKQGHSSASVLVCLVYSIPFGCVNIYPLAVSFSLAITPSEIRRAIVSFSLVTPRGTNTTQSSGGSNQTNIDGDIVTVLSVQS